MRSRGQLEGDKKVKKTISAECFCKAFSKLWQDEAKKRDTILRAYPDETGWTEYMLGKKGASPTDSFLWRVSERLSFTMGKEWYTLDAVYYDKASDLYPRGPRGPYPTCLYVIVEHENRNEHVETEMWKLLQWRSPLKVLIFYDYREGKKKAYEKLKNLFEMGKKVDVVCSEANDTEYLFLVGSRSQDDEVPVWRYWTVNQDAPWPNDPGCGKPLRS